MEKWMIPYRPYISYISVLQINDKLLVTKKLRQLFLRIVGLFLLSASACPIEPVWFTNHGLRLS